MTPKAEQILASHINAKDDNAMITCADTLYSLGELTDAEHTSILQQAQEFFTESINKTLAKLAGSV